MSRRISKQSVIKKDNDDKKDVMKILKKKATRRRMRENRTKEQKIKAEMGGN